MKWLHIKNPEDNSAPRYQVLSYGRLWNFDVDRKPYMVAVSLEADEIKELLSFSGMAQYMRCEEIFKARFPEKKKKFLPNKEQSKLETLFP